MQLGENRMSVECLIIKQFINDSICYYYWVLLNRIFLKNNNNETSWTFGLKPNYFLE